MSSIWERRLTAALPFIFQTGRPGVNNGLSFGVITELFAVVRIQNFVIFDIFKKTRYVRLSQEIHGTPLPDGVKDRSG